MSDQPENAPETDASTSGTYEPGGGPERVVSEESVDDILASLNEAKSRDSSERAVGPSSPGGADETATDEPTGRDAETIPDTPVETKVSSEDETGASLPGDFRDGLDRSDESAESGDALEDLAARVERGTVTGADVRAAEAGDGRDPTPDVGEIDLTTDDLEPTASTSRTDVDRDAGPLAETIGAEGTVPNDEPADDDGDEPGLLGRLRRFFSG